MTRVSKFAFFHFLVIFFLVLFNISVSIFVRSNDLFYIPNENSLGFQFGIIYSSLILLFILWCLIYFKVFTEHPIISVAIISGGLSNYIERWFLFQSVTDYIATGINHFNIADVEIWIGLVLLNLYVWFLDKDPKSNDKTNQNLLAS
ncbi:MAG: signal peptidase II [Patescibacteria group bacterium]